MPMMRALAPLLLSVVASSAALAAGDAGRAKDPLPPAQAEASEKARAFRGRPAAAPAAPAAASPASASAPRAAEEEYPESGRCGKERWAVKTLTDADASKVDFTPVRSTVKALGREPAVSPWNVETAAPDTRILSGEHAETRVLTVRAKVIAYKKAKDSDYHVILADMDHPRSTLVAELSHPDCAAGSVKLAEIAQARRDFLESVGRPPDSEFHLFLADPVPVEITGVRFFDRIHGQTGVAPNGVELHPVLSVRRL